jgi:hypothetical protein
MAPSASPHIESRTYWVGTVCVYVVASTKDEQSELAVRICGAPVPNRSIKHPFGLQPSVGSPMVDAMFSASSRTSFIVILASEWDS